MAIGLNNYIRAGPPSRPAGRHHRNLVRRAGPAGVGTEGSLVEGRDEPVGDCVEESAPEWWPYSSLLRSASASAAVRLATDEPRNAFQS